jgi:hypothetical protein
MIILILKNVLVVKVKLESYETLALIMVMIMYKTQSHPIESKNYGKVSLFVGYANISP